MITPTLTDKQMRIAVYMLAYLRANDNMPCMAHGARDFEMLSNNGFSEHKKALTKKGLLEATEAKGGTYRFARTARGQALLCSVMARAQDQQVSLITSQRLVEAIEQQERDAKRATCPATASTTQIAHWLADSQAA
jgi:DNA-binding IscR family transcriptional regulator